ncbi:MAG: hypothetical protein P4L46_05060 [Fimbriimonas sp.]|nr:hypothetical protein [Fimbriimonas sp.]
MRPLLWRLLALVLLVLTAQVKSDCAYGQTVLPDRLLYNPVFPDVIAASADGRYIAVGDFTGVQILDGTTYGLVKCLPIPDPYLVCGIAFSPDSKTIALCFGSYLNGVELWDTASFTLRRKFNPASTAVNSIAFSPNSKFLVAGGGSYSGTALTVWNVATGDLAHTLDSPNFQAIYSVAYASNGSFVAAAGINLSNSGEIDLISTLSGRVVRSFTAPGESCVFHVALSPDGSMLAADESSQFAPGSASQFVVRDASTGVALYQWPFALGGNGVAFSLDGSTAYGSGNGGTIQTLHGIQQPVDSSVAISLKTGVPTVLTGPTSYVAGFACSPGGKRIYLAAGSAGMMVCDAKTGAIATTIATYLDHSKCTAFMPDGAHIASGGTYTLDRNNGSPLVLWDVATGALLDSMDTFAVNGVMSVATDPTDGTVAISGTAAVQGGTVVGDVEIWNPSTSKYLKSLDMPVDTTVNAVCFNRGGSLLAAGGTGWNSNNGSYGVISIWQMPLGALIRQLNTGLQGVAQIAMSSDGKVLFAYEPKGSRLEVWNPSSGKLIRRIQTNLHWIDTLAASPDGKFVAVGGFGPNLTSSYLPDANYLEIRNAETGTTIASYTNLTFNLGCLVFTPDSSALLVGTEISYDAYDSKTGIAIGSFTGGVGGRWPQWIALSPAGNLLCLTMIGGSIGLAWNPVYDPKIRSFSITVNSLMGGRSTSGSIMLKSPAPPGGCLILVKSNDIHATTPGYVLVPAGAASAQFGIATSSVGAKTSVTITVGPPRSSASASMTLHP